MSENNIIAHQRQVTATAVANEIIPAQESIKQDLYKEELQRLPLQRKLSIGAPDDPLEHEADSMADTIMRMPEQNFIQRQCSQCGGEGKLIRKSVNSLFKIKKQQRKLIYNVVIQISNH